MTVCRGAGVFKIRVSGNIRNKHNKLRGKGEREMKKMNNKGFSLVELIIVIAIMAVLIVVLAPQFFYMLRSQETQRM